MSEQASNPLAEQAASVEASAATRAAISFDDAALVDRCRSGDVQAFESLVAKYQDRVYNLIYRLVGRQHADAEELAQETFLRAMEKIRQFRGGSGFYTWLFRIAANLAISHRRHGAVVRFQPLLNRCEFDDGHAGDAADGLADRREADPRDIMAAEEVRRRVAEAIDALDDEYRAVVVLRDVEDMEYAQIAEILDLPDGTVKSRLYRGRQMLRNALADLTEPT